MTTYRAGQRVRIEWPNGSAVEGVLTGQSYGPPLSVVVPRASGETLWQPDSLVSDGRTVTVLSEPRPDEPQGLGAVVEASAADVASGDRMMWVRARTERNEWRPSTEVSCDNSGFYRAWASLIDPVVLSEGWTP